MACRRELDRVAHEVEEDLPQTCFVADQPERYPLIHLEIQRQAFGPGGEREQLQHGFLLFAELEFAIDKNELSGLGSGQIENVGQQPGQAA